MPTDDQHPDPIPHPTIADRVFDELRDLQGREDDISWDEVPDSYIHQLRKRQDGGEFSIFRSTNTREAAMHAWTDDLYRLLGARRTKVEGGFRPRTYIPRQVGLLRGSGVWINADTHPQDALIHAQNAVRRSCHTLATSYAGRLAQHGMSHDEIATFVHDAWDEEWETADPQPGSTPEPQSA